MKYSWDNNKNRLNQHKHGFDFSDAHRIFEGNMPLLVMVDESGNYAETRYKGIGIINHTAVVVIFAECESDTVRVISLRKATRYEKKQHEKFIKDRLETY